jgi:hypothetical protein
METHESELARETTTLIVFAMINLTLMVCRSAD